MQTWNIFRRHTFRKPRRCHLSLLASISMQNIRKPIIWKIVGNTVINVLIILYRTKYWRYVTITVNPFWYPNSFGEFIFSSNLLFHTYPCSRFLPPSYAHLISLWKIFSIHRYVCVSTWHSYTRFFCRSYLSVIRTSMIREDSLKTLARRK